VAATGYQKLYDQSAWLPQGTKSSYTTERCSRGATWFSTDCPGL